MIVTYRIYLRGLQDSINLACHVQALTGPVSLGELRRSMSCQLL